MSPWLFYCEARRISRGVSMVILLRGKEYFNRVSPWLLYCETRRISRGRLYGFGFRGEENFKRTAICFFLLRGE